MAGLNTNGAMLTSPGLSKLHWKSVVGHVSLLMTQNCPSPPLLVQVKWTTLVPPTRVWPQFKILVTVIRKRCNYKIKVGKSSWSFHVAQQQTLCACHCRNYRRCVILDLDLFLHIDTANNSNLQRTYRKSLECGWVREIKLSSCRDLKKIEFGDKKLWCT